jgi:hypothetical protein
MKQRRENPLEKIKNNHTNKNIDNNLEKKQGCIFNPT